MAMKNWIKWWKCWGKKKAKSGKASYSQSSSLLSTQDTSESDGTQMAAKKNSNNNNNSHNLLHESMNSMYSDAPSMGSTPSSKRLTLRKLSIIKKVRLAQKKKKERKKGVAIAIHSSDNSLGLKKQLTWLTVGTQPLLVCRI